MAVEHESIVNPRAYAQSVVDRHSDEATIALVLEPSPPERIDDPFVADDPAAVTSDGPTIGATSAADRNWATVVDSEPALRSWADAAGLLEVMELPLWPATMPRTRNAMHRVAYSIVAEARRTANTKFGLRFTTGGFGTPFFDGDRQVRVDGSRLVIVEGDQVRSASITSLTEAAEVVGVVPGVDAAEHDSPPLGDLDEILSIDDDEAALLAIWFRFSWRVLEELRVVGRAHQPGRTQLWPGHFDPAVEIGDQELAQRATYGCSPGDDANAEPYLYVGPWGGIDPADEFWNATSFPGAQLPYATLREAERPERVALDFFVTALTKLSAG